MARRPTIVLSCQRREAGNVFKLEPALAIVSFYTDAVWRAGGLPVPLLPIDDAEPDADEVLDSADGVIVIGGYDVDPQRYGQEPDPTTDVAEPLQEAFELALIRRSLERSIPLLAICRGLQLLNVLHGGTLHQHITGAAGFDAHGIPFGGGGTANDFTVEPGSRLGSVVGPTTSGRCHHHQAVDRVGDGLVVVARTADGSVEGLELAEPGDRWFTSVQWHPEETAESQTDSQTLFDALVAASRPIRYA